MPGNPNLSSIVLSRVPFTKPLLEVSAHQLRALAQARAVSDLAAIGHVIPHALVVAKRQLPPGMGVERLETTGPVLYELAFASSDDGEMELATYAFYEWFLQQVLAVAFVLVVEQWVVEAAKKRPGRLHTDPNRKEGILAASVSTLTTPTCQTWLSLIKRKEGVPEAGLFALAAFGQHAVYRLYQSLVMP